MAIKSNPQTNPKGNDQNEFFRLNALTSTSQMVSLEMQMSAALLQQSRSWPVKPQADAGNNRGNNNRYDSSRNDWQNNRNDWKDNNRYDWKDNNRNNRNDWKDNKRGRDVNDGLRFPDGTKPLWDMKLLENDTDTKKTLIALFKAYHYSSDKQTKSATWAAIAENVQFYLQGLSLETPQMRDIYLQAKKSYGIVGKFKIFNFSGGGPGAKKMKV